MKKLLLLLAIGLIPKQNTVQEAPSRNEIRMTQTVEALSSIGKVSTNGSSLNVRKTASTSSTILAKLSNNSYVEIYNELSGFYKVKYNSTSFGYVSKNYCIKASTNIKSVTASVLNVRSGKGTYYTKLAQLPKGYKVGVLSTDNGWSRIVYNGTKTGYVSSTYLSGTTTTTYPSINLNITEYKQYDSKWAYKYLGESKVTFKSNGCATTGLAMLESYRLGRNINPYEYSKTQSYTSGGAIYWPTTKYNVVTSSTSYLTKIYNILKSRKPVMIGLKTSGGKQHYVVIKGYTGSNTLSSKNFIISDPGSSWKTNLSQILSDHPVFYKYIYAK
ncbi:MAG TPA: hypothetical protein DCY93_01500 [Firmicutes bacterium]|nr:hypothetical protein [Bacillota bacterium]